MVNRVKALGRDFAKGLVEFGDPDQIQDYLFNESGGVVHHIDDGSGTETTVFRRYNLDQPEADFAQALQLFEGLENGSRNVRPLAAVVASLRANLGLDIEYSAVRRAGDKLLITQLDVFHDGVLRRLLFEYLNDPDPVTNETEDEGQGTVLQFERSPSR